MSEEKLEVTENIEDDSTKAVSKRTGRAADKVKVEIEAEVKTEMEAEVKVEKPKVVKTTLMYLGPNVPGGILSCGSVFKQMPDYLDDLFEKMPDIKKLFIEVKNICKFKRELGKPGSETFRLYQNIVTLIKEEAGKNVGI